MQLSKLVGAGPQLSEVYLTMDDIIELTEDAGNFYFSKDTRKHFGAGYFGNVRKMSDNRYRFVSRQYINGYDDTLNGAKCFVVTEFSVIPEILERDNSRLRYSVGFDALYDVRQFDPELSYVCQTRAQYPTRSAAICNMEELLTYADLREEMLRQ